MSASVFDMLRTHDILESHAEAWHTIDPPVRGSINGLPTLTGTIVMASGSLAVMLCDDGRKGYVHLTSFIKDVVQPERLHRNCAREHKTRCQKMLDRYCL